MALSKVSTNQIDTAATPTVAEATVTGDLTVDTNTLHVDATNNSVGIGTISPNSYSGYSVLTLNHATSGGLIDIERNGTLVGEIWAHDANTFALQAMGAREISLRTNSSESLKITSAGEVMMANQPCVSARATATNLATETQTTLTLDNERFDVGSNLASNTFTAPVTGKYLFTYTLYFVDIDTANTALGVQVITSNTQYENWISPDHIANSDFFYTATSAQIADMDVNDTLQFKVYINGGPAQTDVHSDSKISIALLS